MTPFIKDYCTQNAGDCSSCSLTNYNRDFQNNPLTKNEPDGFNDQPEGLSFLDYLKAREISVPEPMNKHLLILWDVYAESYREHCVQADLEALDNLD